VIQTRKKTDKSCDRSNVPRALCFRRNATNEVFAYSVLGRHAHIVHYYSSWVEDDRVFIQTEYCSGGSLASQLAECQADGRKRLSEMELKQLTVHIASGLKYIHSHGLVHLDIKPGMLLLLLIYYY